MKLISGTVLQSATRLTVKLVVVAAAAVGGGALVSSSVFASMTAVASASTSVNSGTLILTQVANGTLTAGLTTAISNMASGDVQNRYITLTNGGTLDASALTLTATSSGTLLTTDPTKGLKVNINVCTTAWTSGTCAGSSSVLASTFVSTIIATPAVVSLPTVLTHGGSAFLQIGITLPTNSEVVTNGVTTGLVQGLTDSVTWKFTTTQITNAAVNS